MIAGNRHAVRSRQCALEPLAPAAGCEIDTDAVKLLSRKRQHDVGLAADFPHRLEAKNIRTAGDGPGEAFREQMYLAKRAGQIPETTCGKICRTRLVSDRIRIIAEDQRGFSERGLEPVVNGCS